MKAELTKAKEAAQEAKEATKASEQKSYNLGVQEIEARLTEELAKVYKEYHHEVWIKALNLARVLAASKWRKAENIYYRQDLRKAPTPFLGPGANAAPKAIAPEQHSTTQASLPPHETSKGPSKASDQSQGVEVPKAKELARVVLGQKTKAMVRRPSPCKRPRAQRLLPRPRKLLLRPRMLLPRQRMLLPRQRKLIPRLLVFLSPNQAIKKTLLQPRLNLQPSFFFLSVF